MAFDATDDLRVQDHLALLSSAGIKVEGSPTAWVRRHIYASLFTIEHVVNVGDPEDLKRQLDGAVESLRIALATLSTVERHAKILANQKAAVNGR